VGEGVMKKSMKLLFAISILSPFLMAAGGYWHSSRMQQHFENTPYQEAIKIIRRTDDTESMRKLLIARFESQPEADLSYIEMIKSITELLLGLGIINLCLLMMVLRSRK
jgi:hypothetical protein